MFALCYGLWFCGVMVLWLYGVMVCYGFMVLWFYGSMVLYCMVLRFSGSVFCSLQFYGFVVFWFYGCMLPGFKKYQIAIPCLEEDIDPISKIFKI